MIYLDYAASTPLAAPARAAMLDWMDADQGFGNPASDHAWGRRARAAVERARAQVAGLIGALPEEIIWTSGATEATNLAIKGALEFRGRAGAHLVTSRVEHKSVIDVCRHLEASGVAVTWLVPGADGRIAVEQVIAALRPETLLVSLMWVNNETGAINPVTELAPLLRERGVLLHVDAVQAAGKLPIDVAAVPVDLLSFSAHKVYGPKGIGALFVRKRPRARLAPQLHGGGHEQGMRSGTLPAHQIAGMGAAFALAAERLDADRAHLTALRDAMAAALSGVPGLLRNGGADGAPHVLSFSVEGVEGESLRAALSDIALSSGSACSSATREPSYVLRALGRSDALAGATLRFSFGRPTTGGEIERAAARVAQAVAALRALNPDPAWARPVVPALADTGLDNVHGYPAPVWSRFLRPTHGGIAAGAGLATASVRSPATQARLTLQLGEDGGARFAADGCPYTVAVGQWLAERIGADGLAACAAIRAAQLREALEIPEDRAHCALMGEDLILALDRTAANRSVSES